MVSYLVNYVNLSSDDKEYFTPNNVAEMTPVQCDHTALLLAAARLYLNSQPEAPKNWGEINPNLNDYHSNPTEITTTFRRLDRTDWWRQRDESHSKCTDLSNVVCNIISIIPHGVRVQASFSLQ